MENKQEHYDYIDKLVMDYQQGSEQASLELIQTFGYDPETNEVSWLIGKYFNLLRYGTIKFRNQDTRRFIRLFTSDQNLKEALIPNYQYADAKKQSRKIVQRINDRMEHLADEEIIYDLVSIVLDLAKRFEKMGQKKNFCGYIYNSYHFYVFHHFRYLFKDLSYSNWIEPLDDYLDENSEITIDDKWDMDLYFENETQDLGFNWILGRTTTFPFNQLNQFERTILSLYDHKGLTYEEVGNQMGYHRDTIWNKRKQIKNKLEDIMENRTGI